MCLLNKGQLGVLRFFFIILHSLMKKFANLWISLKLGYTRSSDYTKASSGIFIQKQTCNPETIIVSVL